MNISNISNHRLNSGLWFNRFCLKSVDLWIQRLVQHTLSLMNLTCFAASIKPHWRMFSSLTSPFGLDTDEMWWAAHFYILICLIRRPDLLPVNLVQWWTTKLFCIFCRIKKKKILCNYVCQWKIHCLLLIMNSMKSFSSVCFFPLCMADSSKTLVIAVCWFVLYNTVDVMQRGSSLNALQQIPDQ